MGVPCPGCGRSYTEERFRFGRALHCTCGARVVREPRLRSGSVSGAPRFFADAMLGRLARWLRMAGFDTRHDPHVEDADLIRIAFEEGRVVLTRDRALPEQWSVEDIVVLDGRDAFGQLREVGERFALDWVPRAFTRCSRCNALLEPVEPEAVSYRVPESVLARGAALVRCPACGRVYWEGSHTERVRRVLTRALGSAPTRRD